MRQVPAEPRVNGQILRIFGVLAGPGNPFVSTRAEFGACNESRMAMPGPVIRYLTHLLGERPSPADVAEVVRATPIGAGVTALNALLFAAAGWVTLGGVALAGWLSGTLAISLYVLRRSLRARTVVVTRVSQRAARRLVLTSFLLALPWGLLAAVIVPLGTPADRLLGFLACAGMALCAVLMMQRTLLAAVTYVVTVSAGILGGCLVTGEPAMIVVAIYNLLLASFVTYNAYLAGETAKERDRTLARLSKANRELEDAYSKISTFVFHDVVTGLPNRKAFVEALGREIEAAHRDGRPRAVMILDLDNFKNINDSFGHAAGDALLSIAGARVVEVLDGAGTAARLGGDEFGVVAAVEETGALEDLARDLIAAVSVPATVMGRQVFPGTSIGIAVMPDHAETVVDLMQKADAALGLVKEQGKGGWSMFDLALRKKLENSDQIGADLKVALETGGLSVHYQPKINLETGALSGAEALARWNHPTLGPVRPDKFLPVAAERAMMHELSAYIFDRVARDILTWRASGLEPGRVSINIHPLDLKEPDHLMRILARLVDRGLGPDAVSLEITESCFVGRGTEAVPMILDAISDMGFKLSLDDFGTGHAALSYLRHLPVDEIKIDQAFVANVASSQSDRSIVEATIAFARGMGLRSVAEGVETIDQIDALRQIGTDLGQGFFWSRSLAPDALAQFVSSYEAAAPSEGKAIERRSRMR